jgi:hypothetical protein
MSPQVDGPAQAEAVDLENARQKSLDVAPVEFEPEDKLNNMPEYKQDAFGNEEFAEVKYKIMKWWYVHDLILASLEY